MLKIDCNIISVEKTNNPGKRKVRCVGSTSREDWGLGPATISFSIESREIQDYPIGRPISLVI